MSLYVILGTPGAFDFQAFWESTRKALDLLAPLTEGNAAAGIAQQVTAQARQLVGAIQLSLSAVQAGFTAIEDIIAFAGLMNQGSPDELREYLIGTLELADKAYTSAQEAYQTFRNIRTTMYELTAELSNQPLSSGRRPRLETDPDLNRGIDALEAFSTQVSALAQWWDWIKVETGAHHYGRPRVELVSDSLSQPAVIERWMLLKRQCAQYYNMGRELEDRYPHLLIQATSNNSSSQNSTASQLGGPRSSHRRPDLVQALKTARTEFKSRSCPPCTIA